MAAVERPDFSSSSSSSSSSSLAAEVDEGAVDVLEAVLLAEWLLGLPLVVEVEKVDEEAEDVGEGGWLLVCWAGAELGGGELLEDGEGAGAEGLGGGWVSDGAGGGPRAAAHHASTSASTFL